MAKKATGKSGLGGGGKKSKVTEVSLESDRSGCYE